MRVPCCEGFATTWILDLSNKAFMCVCTCVCAGSRQKYRSSCGASDLVAIDVMSKKPPDGDRARDHTLTECMLCKLI